MGCLLDNDRGRNASPTSEETRLTWALPTPTPSPKVRELLGLGDLKVKFFS